MTYRVIQWATGYVGQESIKGILAHPELELVGVFVYSDSKNGLDAGDICGIAPTGVIATSSIDEILALDADCVVYTPMLSDQSELIRILESGKNVVTPVGYIFPSGRFAEIEAACRAGGVSLHGTGINPGGITERFPLMLSALCRDIRHVRCEEFSDIRNYGAELVVREVMLFGKTLEVASNSPMLKILGDGFGQSIRMIASELGWSLDDELRTTHAMAITKVDIETLVGRIDAGTVAAQRFTWEGTVNGEAVITVTVNWLMGEENLEPAWSLGEERFEIAFDADPPISATFHGLHPEEVGEEVNVGLIAPAMHCVNAIPYVVPAAPGFVTYLDLPLIAGRATQRSK
ncbi:unannotated protein [freshwater metagenome]|uniref:Unannotated protein n=1 Tax=freshwater metagenome TaxID=449393 RepID=A0A6J6XS56_9ZZZZ|nr:dihydrodipicolinate reductase [Actinomycetota bacterium]